MEIPTDSISLNKGKLQSLSSISKSPLSNVLAIFLTSLVVGSVLVKGVAAEGILTGCLYPLESESREVKSLDGVWHFRASLEEDDLENGFREKWFLKSLQETGDVELMPVPSSYNDITQNKALRDHVGWVWYSTKFWVPKRWRDDIRTVSVRFGSANHLAVVWVNGHHLLNHTGGYLPFKGDVTSLLNYGSENILVVALNNTLTPLTVPQGTLHYPNDPSRYPKGFTVQGFNFDYFNFAGIHRPVYLYTTPAVHVDDITVVTTIEGTDGLIQYKVEYKKPTHFENSIYWNSQVGLSTLPPTCLISIKDKDGVTVATKSVSKEAKGCGGTIKILNAKLWWPYLSEPEGQTPGYLYTLEVRLVNGDKLGQVDTNHLSNDEDVYHLKFGVRTVEVEKEKFLINGRPFYFQGFGRHEDYSIRGRGVDPVLLVKDHNLIKWTGANSYRTSHYPYAEEILDLTDQLGIVIIDESPAIGLTGYGKELKSSHIAVMKDLVQRDKNRASVVMWSIGNEPKSMEAAAPAYFQEVIEETRQADASKRPITIVLSQNFSGGQCPSNLDVISINRYYGWYSDTGKTQVIRYQIPTEVELWYDSYKKPVLVTEYGAGTVAGMHQSPSFVWTEDFQVDYLFQHFEAFDYLRKTKDYFLGEMIWNFADFATPEETFRPWGCMKGVFTRERQPKQAAHFVRARYWTLANITAERYKSKPCPLPQDLHLFHYVPVK